MSKTYPLRTAADLSPLLNAVGDAKVVMLGEASHGTHEYYTWRTAISKRLIEEKGFSFIAVEGDWPDCYRVNRYIKGYPGMGTSASAVLAEFNRWPTWMWANWETVALAEWLKSFNAGLSSHKRRGFYGLDVYSLWESLETMHEYLSKEDPPAARHVAEVLKCFEPYGEQPQAYAYDAAWNLRDTHMIDTLDRLLQFHGPQAKAIVWEHNTHIGDARATNMAGNNMINTGQLAREKYGRGNVYLVGFGSYRGTVMAAEAWDAPMQKMDVPPAQSGSVEAQLHNESTANRYYLMHETGLRFDDHLPHRAIGVIYDPKREQYGNYVPSALSMRYDAFMYLDQTNALHPLHIKTNESQIPETFPFGL